MSELFTRRWLVVAGTSLAFALAGPAPAGPAASVDYDGDGVTAPADCDDFDAAVHAGAADRPDVKFEDSNCDGIDGDRNRAIFVDAIAGNDANAGDRAHPKRTLASALVAAKAVVKDVY